ncbi:MAG: arginase [Oscillochloris sp.]|nr:arginase [Oscillochloris sp.]
MATTVRPLAALHVVGIRYRGSLLAEGDACGLDALVAAGVYWDAGLPVTYSEPRLPAGRCLPAAPANLGLIGAVVGDAVVDGLAARRAVLISGGDCTHAVGVLAGLQRAYGPAARIGVIWLDAHGDFNTPATSLTGMLAGMPLAVSAGLALPVWRERAGLTAPIPTDRILLVDARNLDAPEAQLIRATDVQIAAVEPSRPGRDLGAALAALAARCDLLYLHVDVDILDRALVPNNPTAEPDGPQLAAVVGAIELAMATGKVAAYAVISLAGAGAGREIGVESCASLIRSGLAAWRRHGQAG